MSAQKSAAWDIALSFFCYLAGVPLLTHFVAPNGVGGVLLAYPLYAATWLGGKKAGFATAAAGVALNFLIWTVAGNGAFTIPRAGALYVIVLLLVECVASAAFVFTVSILKQRELKVRAEIERSKNLLRVSESKYRHLIEIAPASISIVENGRVTFCNRPLLEMLGYSRQEMIGMEISRIFHKDDVGEAMERYPARAQGRQLPKAVYRDVRKDGRVIWVESVGQLIEWEGRPAVLYFTSEVTDRIRAEEALRESEDKYRVSESKYRNLIEGAPESVWVVEDAKVIFCNTHFLEMLGYSNDEMIGMPLQAITFREDLEKAMERYAARAQGKILPKSVTRQVRKDGKVIWMETIGQGIDWEGKAAVLYFSSDVTERKAFEEQFAQAQKMEAIGRLAGGVAHDFNNILQVILGFCSMMRGYPDDRNAILNDLGVIEDSARRAASLTQQLLAFSRKQVIQPKVIDLGALVQQSEKMLSRVLGEDIAVSVILSGEESCVKADSGQVQQVIMNLVINARDAMPEGGRITISVENVTVQEPASSELPAGDYVRLSVGDTGRGMDAETKGHLFEPFFTTKPHGTGTGLGLSIVYGIVRQSGGHIRAESRVGQGSTFIILLPRVFEATDDARSRVEVEIHHGHGSILVVEDQAWVRQLVRSILERAGYAITEAESGEEALTICRKRDEAFDLLITDVVLAGMRGDEIAEAVRRLTPRTQVIYMSGYVDSEHLANLEGAPVLQKPFSAATLLEHVKKVLAEPEGR